MQQSLSVKAGSFENYLALGEEKFKGLKIAHVRED